MYKKLLFLLVLIFALQGVYSADVDVKTYIYSDSTIFNYIFEFNQNDSINKFALERPSDAKLDYIVDDNGKIKYDEAGDYYIVELDEEEENCTIYIKFTSQEISKEILQTNSFRNYINFNFKADKLTYEVHFNEDLGELIDIFPQEYQVYNSEKIRWVSYDVDKESLFIINFKNAKKATQESSFDALTITYIVIPTLLLIITILILFRKNKQLNHLQNKIIENKQTENKTQKTQLTKEKIEEKPQETFEEIIQKHLTENEQNVVVLIKENEGISQYDILNHLPHLTKSNLSKIISKLHAKKILKRIKVGKVNNIYLGEKLEHTKED